MSANLTFIIRAYHKTAEQIETTIKSIARNDYPTINIAIIGNNLDNILEVLNKESDPNYTHPIFNKNPYGIPTFCLGLGNGKINNSYCLNTLIKETYEYSDVFSFLLAGDTIRNDYCTKVINSINECPNVISIVYSDYYLKGLRFYSEPFIKDKVNMDWKFNQYTIPKYVFDHKGLFPESEKCENDYLFKIIEDRIAVHIPEPISYHE